MSDHGQNADYRNTEIIQTQQTISVEMFGSKNTTLTAEIAGNPFSFLHCTSDFAESFQCSPKPLAGGKRLAASPR